MVTCNSSLSKVLMSIPTLSLELQRFIISVPICSEQVTLEAILAIVQSIKNEAIVVVNEQQSPLGLINCASLLSHLLKQSSNSLELSFSTIDLHSFIEPLIVLPARISVKDLLPYLQVSNSVESNHKSFALVDLEGKFLGLLDSWSLLQSLLTSSKTFSAITPEQKTLTFQQLLCQLIEQLPLPLMLQHPEGKIICQNIAWRKQIGELNLPHESNLLKVEKNKFWLSKPNTLIKENISRQETIQPDCLNESHYLATQITHKAFQDLVPQLLSDLGKDVPKDKDKVDLPTNLNNFPVSRENQKDKLELELNILNTETKNNSSERLWQLAKLPLNLPNSLFWENQESSMWLTLATDITEQQKLYQELTNKNADLAQVNRLKDDFLAYISHELKSPLTSVVGLSSLLKEQKLGELNSRQTRYAQLIYQSGRQLMTLINDLLDLTRLETGELHLNRSPVKIRTICEDAYEQALIQLSWREQKNKSNSCIPFTLTIETGLETLITDELRLRQMLVKLLENALKFTQEDGQIGLKVNRWNSWITFTVWDTGIGVPDNLQPLIFQKFQQLDNPLTRQFAGTGIGLMLTQRLAQANGGDVSFISKVDQGSKFTLLLPFSSTEQKTEIEEPKSPNFCQESKINNSQLLANKLVLIAQTAPKYIDNLAERLIELDYHVVIARTGTEALEKVRQLKPCATLLNPVLPLLSGWDVLTLLKSDFRTKDIPVIVTAPKREKHLSEKYGANDFLSLPVEKEVLKESLIALYRETNPQIRGLAILHLHPNSDKKSWFSDALNSKFEMALSTKSLSLNHRIVEADSLEQAEILARVWKIDVMLLDGSVLEEPFNYLRSLSQCEPLVSLPLVTLDAKTTQAANQITGLSVFPCLVPGNENSLEDLWQVIEIAAGIIE